MDKDFFVSKSRASTSNTCKLTKKFDEHSHTHENGKGKAILLKVMTPEEQRNKSW